MTSQPSTSNPTYYDHLYSGDSMNMYSTMDYSSSLICSMQYFNNTHNRYQIPTHPSYPIHQPLPHQLLHDDPFSSAAFVPVAPPPRPPPQQISNPYTLMQLHPPVQQQQPPVEIVAQQPTQMQTSANVPHPVPIMTSAMDSCQQISHVLQCYQQGGEDADFVRKAIESLVKKLKDRRIELDALITAVTSAGKQPTCCVTIQRSLDGRLQVAGKKGVPHVVYARIWRWPNVNKNELVKLVQCQTSPDHPDFICINPYHYERVVSNGIVNLDNGLHVETPPMFGRKEMDYGESSGGQEFMEWPNSPNYNGQFSCVSQVSNSSYDEKRVDLNMMVVPPQMQHLDYWCSIVYYELDTQIGETFKVSTLDHGKIIIDGGMDPHGENEGRFCLGALSNVHRTEASDKARMHIGKGVEITAHADGNVSITSNTKIFVRSGYLDWCQGVEYGSKAHRFTADNKSHLVFDIRWAYMQMKKRSKSSNEAVRAQAAAVAGFAPLSVMPSVMPDSGVDRMRRDFCTIAISFVKGWGEMYQRQSIKETPCWIEIHLHRSLQLLDQLLKSSSFNL